MSAACLVLLTEKAHSHVWVELQPESAMYGLCSELSHQDDNNFWKYEISCL